MRTAPWLLLAAFAGVLIVQPLPADNPPQKKDEKKDEKKEKPATVKVETGPLAAVVTLTGVALAERPAEVSIRPKAMMGMPLLVKKAVEHGAPVKKGDVLVEFDAEKADLALRDAKLEAELSRLSLQQAEAELPLAERTVPLDLADAERRQRRAADDLQRFLEIDKPSYKESAQFELRSADFSVESGRDELAQLEKMYRDKDLTEETERIILKRYKFYAEMYDFMARQTRLDVDRTLKVFLPRREQSAKDDAARAEISLERAKAVASVAVEQKRLMLAKTRLEARKTADRLADLQHDRDALTVKAPADGLAYHGKSVRGQWAPAAGPMGPGGLLPGGMVAPGDTFLTVVPTSTSVLRADADEKDLFGLTAGLAGKATPAAAPDKPLAAKVSRVAASPLGGKYEVLLDVDGAGLVPGRTCSVKLVTAKRKGAKLLPTTAVYDDPDGDGKCVYLPAKEGKKPEKKEIVIGLTANGKAEVLDGLAEGDEVLAAKP